MMRIENGVSVRETLEKLASGLIPDPIVTAQLAAEPPLPAYTADVWAVFLDLHIRRHYDENGPVRWSWSELGWYSRMTGRRLDQWQLNTLFALENAFFAVRAEHKD